MAKYALIYHGGGMPETEEEGARLMTAWGTWMQGLGGALLDAGNPFGASTTIQSDGSTVAGGGANPASGYSLIDADSLDAAVAAVAGCPILDAGGSVEVAETHDMWQRPSSDFAGVRTHRRRRNSPQPRGPFRAATEIGGSADRWIGSLGLPETAVG